MHVLLLGCCRLRSRFISFSFVYYFFYLFCAFLQSKRPIQTKIVASARYSGDVNMSTRMVAVQRTAALLLLLLPSSHSCACTIIIMKIVSSMQMML